MSFVFICCFFLSLLSADAALSNLQWRVGDSCVAQISPSEWRRGAEKKRKKKSPILMFYPGRLTEVAEKSCRVQFEDGSEKLIGALGITPVRFLILFPLLFLMIFLKDEAVAAPAKTSVSLKTAVSALTKPPVAAVAEPPLQKQVLLLFLFFFVIDFMYIFRLRPIFGANCSRR